MKLLKEIEDKEIPKDESDLEVREASRAVLFDENRLVPILFVSKYNYHKLPGGGIEKGENKIEALNREVKEEVGCEIEITGEVGEILEFRSKIKLKQTSYCFLGKIISKGNPDFTEEEKSEGYEIVWMTLDEAISKTEKDEPENYEGSFIQKRDLIFLKEAKKILTQHPT